MTTEVTTKRKIFYSLFAIVGLVWLTLGACSIIAPAPKPAPVEVSQPQPVVKPIKKPVLKTVQQKAKPKTVPVAPVAQTKCLPLDAICHLIN